MVSSPENESFYRKLITCRITLAVSVNASAMSVYGVAPLRRTDMRRSTMAWLGERMTSARCGRLQIGSH